MISDLLRKGTRRLDLPPGGIVAGAGPDRDRGFLTNAFRKFISSLSARESPVLVDLGPVVGQNVTFLGERLGCKIFVEDLFSDLEAHARQGRVDAFPEFLRTRLAQPTGTVDGILCWDALDYLDRAAAQELAAQLCRLLRPGGVLLGLFATAEAVRPHYTKYIIVDDHHLRHQPYPATRRRQPVWLNRDIIRMFEGLLVSDSFLLRVNTREILFRKPATLGADRVPTSDSGHVV